MTEATAFLRVLCAPAVRGRPTPSEARAALGSAPGPVEVALLGGRRADRLGSAFAVGYDEALRALFVGLDPARPAALCVTEAGGTHPRAVRTRLGPDGRVTGEKTFATLLGPEPTLLVLVRADDRPDEERGDLRLVRVAADAPGVSLRPARAVPVVPEIGHAVVRFDGAPVAEVLPGDGWADHVRRFRAVEDLHVGAATVGYLLGVAIERGWPTPLRARLVALALAFRALDGADDRAPEVHVALAGGLAALDAVAAAAEEAWALVPDEEAARWRRDRPLLGLAAGPRAQRLEGALARLGWITP